MSARTWRRLAENMIEDIVLRCVATLATHAPTDTCPGAAVIAVLMVDADGHGVWIHTEVLNNRLLADQLFVAVDCAMSMAQRIEKLRGAS